MLHIITVHAPDDEKTEVAAFVSDDLEWPALVAQIERAWPTNTVSVRGATDPTLVPTGAIAPPSRKALEAGDLDDDFTLPLDVRAARAWHRAMSVRNNARDDKAANMRMAVRRNVSLNNLDEARRLLLELIEYAKG